MVTERTQSLGGLVLICGLSAGLLSVHLLHAAEPGEGHRSLVLGILFPIAQATAGLAGGVWLWRSDLTGTEVGRVGSWCAFGAAVLATGGLLTVLYQQAEGVMMSDWRYIIANAATGGLLGGFVVGVYDSRQRVARRKAAAAGERAERLSDQLTVLNRVLRHDLRNGVNLVQGHANLIAENEPAVADRAEKIEAEAQRLVELGEQAREIEAVLRSDETDREVVDLVAIVDAAIEQVRTAESDVEFSVSLPDRLRIRAHPLVSSAVRNVVENAVDHCDEPTPRVAVDADAVERDGTRFVELRVADNGPGIPDEQVTVLERGFETSLEHGSGLGLWLVHWLVTASDGHVRFEDNDPKGSVVRLQFEAVDDPTADSRSVAD
ncbi:sensor histidine kinase [Haloparvum sp. PAK95]|uniref:sensor histidine kinase n=1 Tax=Haloparvum sp. PAK95 TaxID=3418962 RepID=UPI003D2F4FBE